MSSYPVQYRETSRPAPAPGGGGFQRPTPPRPANDNFPPPANDNEPVRSQPFGRRVRPPKRGIPWSAVRRATIRVSPFVQGAVYGYIIWRLREGNTGWQFHGWEQKKVCSNLSRDGFVWFTSPVADSTVCATGQVAFMDNSIGNNARTVRFYHREGGDPWGPWATVDAWERGVTGPVDEFYPEFVQFPGSWVHPVPRPPPGTNPVGLPINWPVADPVPPTVRPGGRPRPDRPPRPRPPEPPPRGFPGSDYGPRPEPPVVPRKPPRDGEKERKIRGGRGLFNVIQAIFHTTSEALDMLDAIYDALPRHLQAKGKPTPQEKMLLIYEHFEYLDLNKMVFNLYYNHISDAVFGRIAGAAQTEATRRGIVLGPSGSGFNVAVF